MDSFKQQIDKIDLSLKQAQFAEAKVLFFKLAEQKCPREYLVEICQIARRLNLPYYILRWLYPVIYPEKSVSLPATDAEKALFAVGLTRVGAFAEAKDILTTLPDSQADKLFALGMLFIWQWEYEKSLRPMKKYIQLFPEGHYSHLIGVLNLTAAYVVADDFEQAAHSASILLSHCSNQKLPLIRANTLEILAQISVRQGRLLEAETYLNESAEILKSSGSDYELFVNKWKLILALMRHSAKPEELEVFKLGAQKKRVFEAAREIDLHLAMTFRRQEDLFRVYAGTRFPGYKRRIKKIYQLEAPPPRSFRVSFGEGDNQTIVNLSQISLTPKSRDLLKIVMSDFYRPIQLGEIFREMYPDEKFNPLTSLPRLYQVFSRTRQELEKEQIPIDLLWKHKQISWRPRGAFQLEVGREKKEISLLTIPFAEFTVSQVLEFFSISQSTAYRMLEQAIAFKKIKVMRPGVFKKI